MHIVDLHNAGARAIDRAAEALVEGFAAHWPTAWPDIESARAEVAEALEGGKVCRAAVDDHNVLLGWVGGMPSYAMVWELHPLVVRPQSQGRGVGRALVEDLVVAVRARGGLTLTLGSDDEDDMTSLSGVDLYPDPWPHIASIRNLRRHPYAFYQRCGFVITGVVPDANGPGRPDILMARRV
ncbi:GNAT family N-acetyltransferase [Oscillochloris sp. ZM17-4]|uniref:GNAT family N-acetyltransferase n=1 Tax=Oscillochloris sp. ZM17-4 TaxID=2866714 RepID=UPI001C73D674|nr:GNAT family N-acetyltransferase [Oscillochloris sp. ZM17-4]MBX0330135.1 GNAT family N-acetyltransferase [Oscillochloris sp. ZM17-4]